MKNSQPNLKNMLARPRRNRSHDALRELTAETHLNISDLVYPLFLMEGKGQKQVIPSMPGQFRNSCDNTLKIIEKSLALGLKAFALFPAINDKLKDKWASESKNPDGLLQTTLQEIKRRFPEAFIITDVAMDPYSSDGHDGIVENGEILNDPTLEVLANMAISQAKAGADMVAPSDMMDGRIGFIRRALDNAGFQNVGILSYCVKYASAYYGPFREALNSAPKSGDKKTYQMDPRNSREALRELRLDTSEGADIVMVKPALSYLDVIKKVKDRSLLPVAAYNVSGEYAMVKAAAEKGWIDERAIVLESLTSMKRAGADIIFTYHALDVAGWLRK